jgi:hypothetical protein
MAPPFDNYRALFANYRILGIANVLSDAFKIHAHKIHAYKVHSYILGKAPYPGTYHLNYPEA